MHFPSASWKPRWFVDETVLRKEGSRDQGRRLTYQALELGTNNFSVTLVAALGFFTGTYVLFASNTTLPMLGFIYWYDARTSSHETSFNAVTTVGCIVGMVGMGILADIYGRRKLYGFEIIVLMIGSIGVVMSSTGYMPLDDAATGSLDVGSIDYGSFGSMNIQGSLLFFRFVCGLGIGGEYPLTATIASEFSPTTKRPRILAIVFAMQSLGVAVASIVSLVVTKVVQARHPYDPAHPHTSARAVDQIWRWVVGLALIPATATAVMRFTIPESPRYTLDVLNDPLKALEETQRLRQLDPGSDAHSETGAVPMSQHQDSDGDESIGTLPPDAGYDSQGNNPVLTIRQYFWVEGNWRHLVATSLGWFLMDFAFFAQALIHGQTLSKFWNGPVATIKNPKIWNLDTSIADANIFSILIADNIHSLVIVSVPAILGNLALILFITRLNRKLLNWVMFIVTGILLLVTGLTLLKTTGSQTWGIAIAVYALCGFSIEFGTGTLTFLIPAEIFPTKYRASCHGISAGVGKLGAILASVFLRYVTFGEGPHKITPSSSPSAWMSYVLIVFSVPMFMGAVVSWLWIPQLQDKHGKSKTLEELALGRNPGAGHTTAVSDMS